MDVGSDGVVQDETIETTSANGLSITTDIYTGPDNLKTESKTDVTVINADGSRTETLTETAMNGSVLPDGASTYQRIQTTSADGRDITIQIDDGANGVNDQVENIVTAADGSQTITTSYYNNGTVDAPDVAASGGGTGGASTGIEIGEANPVFAADGTQSPSMVETISADGLVQTQTQGDITSTTTMFANANGSYQWTEQEGSYGTFASATHFVDANGVDTWTSTTAGGSVTVQLGVGAEEEDIGLAAGIYYTLFGRGMEDSETQALAQYIQGGVLDQTALANSLLSSPEFLDQYYKLTDTAYVTLLCQNAFGETPAATDLSTYVSALESGTLTRAQVLTDVAQEAEEELAGAGLLKMSESTGVPTTVAGIPTQAQDLADLGSLFESTTPGSQINLPSTIKELPTVVPGNLFSGLFGGPTAPNGNGPISLVGSQLGRNWTPVGPNNAPIVKQREPIIIGGINTFYFNFASPDGYSSAYFQAHVEGGPYIVSGNASETPIVWGGESSRNTYIVTGSCTDDQIAVVYIAGLNASNYGEINLSKLRALVGAGDDVGIVINPDPVDVFEYNNLPGSPVGATFNININELLPPKIPQTHPPRPGDDKMAAATVSQFLNDKIVLNSENGGFAILDTAANVEAAIGEINADPNIQAIGLTDTPVLMLTAAEALSDTAAISKIANSLFGVVVQDTAANIVANRAAIAADPDIVAVRVDDSATGFAANAGSLAGVSDLQGVTITDSAGAVLENAGALDSNSQVVGISVVDTAANVLSNSSALAGVSKLTSVAVADSATNIMANALALQSNSAINAIDLVDTAANVLNAAPDLGNAAWVSGFTVSDTVANVQENATALGDIQKVSGIEIADTAANVAANLDFLSQDSQVTSISLTGAETPTLTLSAGQALDDISTLSKITNASYNIEINDTVANVSDNIDALNALSSISSVTLTDGDTPTLLISASQYGNDKSILGKISNDNWSIAIADTAAGVSEYFDALSGDTRVTKITLTDADEPILYLTIPQALDDTRALTLITNPSYQLNLSGTVADVISNQTALNANQAIASLNVYDTIAHIVSNLPALQSDSQVTSINISDTAANVLVSAASLKTSVASVVVSDTAASVAANLDDLDGDTQVDWITLTDPGTPTLTLTAEQTADTTALGEITNAAYNINVVDTAANVSQYIDAMNSANFTITLTDTGAPVLSLSVYSALQDTVALTAITNQSYQIDISDTAADVAANIDALDTDSAITSITLTDGGTPALSLTVAQALHDTNALSKIDSGYQIEITDTAANVVPALSALAQNTNVASIDIVDDVQNVVANASVLASSPLVTAIDVTDTAANVATNIAVLNSLQALDSVTVVDNVADVLQNLSALQSLSIGVTIEIQDTPANVAANLAALT